MKTQHTPGPWKIDFVQLPGWKKPIARICGNYDGKYGDVIALITTEFDGQGRLLPKQEWLSNGLIMAASLDLLEACKAMESALSEVPCISNKQEASRIQARQAIAKAEGKE